MYICIIYIYIYIHTYIWLVESFGTAAGPRRAGAAAGGDTAPRGWLASHTSIRNLLGWLRLGWLKI